MKLIEIQTLLAKAQRLTSELVNAQPKPEHGTLPTPECYQRVKLGLFDALRELQKRDNFTVSDARKLAEAGNQYLKGRSDSSFSSALSEWAKAGYIEVVKRGSGPRPTIYKIPVRA